ncbi:MAG TPA: sodium:glutamate symporter [Spirochaetes bacterium]|nr:sodium:glutamate symporter [Spirochaetota bacterium]
MTFSWSIFIDLGIVSLGLLIASFIRAKILFFQRYRIPNSVTAGFLLLPFYNFLAPILGLDTVGLGNLVFHLLNISFISMSLRDTGKATGKSVLSTATVILSQYSIQSLLGIGVTFLFIATIIPDLFPSFGLLITLGFALGPGQAFAIGTNWEEFGFVGGGSVGLTFAAMGFLWAFLAGIFLINRAIKKNWIDEKRIKYNRKKYVQNRSINDSAAGSRNNTADAGSSAIDPMSYNLAVVFGVYLGTFLLLKLLTFLISFAGDAGNELVAGLWGITFIFAAMVAVLVKNLFTRSGISHTIDTRRLNRISGTSVDIMVTASIGAISLEIFGKYWLPIVVLGILGGVISAVSLLWLSSRIFGDSNFHRFILLFGSLTGTLPAGLALLRVIDPDFKSLAVSDYMYALSIVFFFAVPFMISMNFPARGYSTGNPLYYWITTGIYFANLIFVLLMFRIIAGKGAFREPGKLWSGK